MWWASSHQLKAFRKRWRFLEKEILPTDLKCNSSLYLQPTGLPWRTVSLHKFSESYLSLPLCTHKYPTAISLEKPNIFSVTLLSFNTKPWRFTSCCPLLSLQMLTWMLVRCTRMNSSRSIPTRIPVHLFCGSLVLVLPGDLWGGWCNTAVGDVFYAGL